MQVEADNEHIQWPLPIPFPKFGLNIGSKHAR